MGPQHLTRSTMVFYSWIALCTTVLIASAMAGPMSVMDKFKKFDSDNSSTISETELMDAYKKFAQKLFEMKDNNGDKKLSKFEYFHGHKFNPKKPKGKPTKMPPKDSESESGDMPTRRKRGGYDYYAFKMMDSNKDGSVDMKEFVSDALKKEFKKGYDLGYKKGYMKGKSRRGWGWGHKKHHWG